MRGKRYYRNFLLLKKRRRKVVKLKLDEDSSRLSRVSFVSYVIANDSYFCLYLQLTWALINYAGVAGRRLKGICKVFFFHGFTGTVPMDMDSFT